jgi:ketosteroid isomerase-like protein
MRNVMLAAMVVAAAGCADAAVDTPLTPGIAAQAHVSWRADLNAARAELLAADRAHGQATAASLADGFAGFLAPEAKFLPPRADPLTGPEAAREYLQASPLFGSMTWAPVKADVSADGKSGWTLGFGSVVTRDGATTFSLRVLSFWKRQPGGAWKVEASVPVMIVGLEPTLPPAGFGTPASQGIAGARPGLDAAVSLEELMQADRDFAAMGLAEGPQKAFVAYAAPDGMTITGPEYGRAAIEAAFEGFEGSVQWGPVDGGVAESGDLGWSIGLATFDYPAPTGKRYTKYLTIWQRQPNGRWLYVADGGSSRPAPAS